MASSTDKKICVFACRFCSLLGAERAGRDRLPLPAGIRLMPVSCAGSVSADAVIQAFVNGASGVAVLGCHLGGCRHNDANRDEHVRLETLADLLEAVGIDRRRLLISWGTAHEAEQYARTMNDFAAELDTLPAMLPVAPASEKRPERPAPVLDEGVAAPAELRGKAAEAIRSGKAVLALSASSRGPVPALFRTEAELEALVCGVKYPLGKLAGRILRDRRAGAVQGTDDLALRASALACEAPLAVLCRACDARALKEQAALNQFPAEELCFIPEACSPEQVAACGCERPEWPGEAPSEAAPALPADLAANAARWQKEFSRCVQCHWCRTACPVCVCPTCALDECAVLPAGMMPPSPLGYHLARAMHVADVCVQCGACQDVCPQGLPLLELHRAVARSLKARGYASGEGKASPMRAQRRLGDALGIAAPEWKSTGGKKA